jgi:uncharacterized protein (TIGR03118 family)
MKESLKRSRISIAIAALLVAIFTASAFAAGARSTSENVFVAHNLVSDEAGVADHVDPNLVNAWGLTSLPTSPWWVADNETNVSTLYQADGTILSRVVEVPNAPTGDAANPGTNFVIHEGAASAPARFLFDTEEGKILGWNPAVSSPHAVVAVDRSNVGAIYKGLAIELSATGTADFLYAADFHNARIDVFNGSFGLVTAPGAFVDPKLPDGYAPFGIANLSGQIFVSYAKQDAEQSDEIAGQGLGFVDRFTTMGAFLGRVASHGQLNAPWGLARAPASFGPFGGDLLVGNFGDGEINAYEPQTDGTYERVGPLRDEDHKPILIDGLWALAFGKGATSNGPIDTLFFTAGPDDEEHGLFGTIRAK